MSPLQETYPRPLINNKVYFILRCQGSYIRILLCGWKILPSQGQKLSLSESLTNIYFSIYSTGLQA